MKFSGIPVLTYHAVNIIENTYQGNDHIALASDLRTLDRLGWSVIPLSKVVDWHQSGKETATSEKFVAITCDDGSWFDFYDLEHPTCGLQQGFLGIIRDFANSETISDQSGAHITSFVISSPQARTELDQKGLINQGWWGDEWWQEAQAGGLMSIECHSWDHVHPDVEIVAQKEQLKGDFSRVNSLEDCDVQVRQAGEYISQQMNSHRPDLFAYPWGQTSEYILKTYMPDHSERHGFRAAFTTDPKPVERSDSVWALPRYIFGRDWKSPQDLERLLKNIDTEFLKHD